MKHVYAVGFRHYVELRVADKPPKRYVTHVNRPAITTKVHVCGATKCYERTVKKRLKLTIMYHTGGKVLCSMLKKKFPCHVEDGRAIKLPRDVAQRFLKEYAKN